MDPDRPHQDDCVRHQKPPRNTFRRPRAGRACGGCHSKRVRCDAGIRGLPCTNCAAFSLECSIPLKKKEREAETVGGLKRTRHRRNIQQTQEQREPSRSPEPEYASNYATLIEPEVAERPIEDAGRVFYLAEMSNMSVLLQDDYNEPASKVHYQFPPDWEAQTIVPSRVDGIELEILRVRGALSLPPQEMRDELVNAFFTWVAPIVPIIDQRSFMKRYRDPGNSPSMLLMQAILLAGSRVCTTERSMDSNGSSIPPATLFYQRAKALYDADYEKDRVTVVQALVLMGWYWEDPGKVTKNVFYWNGLAVSIAHGFGMHRSARDSHLSSADKRLWKRIWWTLFTRDRSVAAALGRPMHISLKDSDVEMIMEEDFIDEDGSEPNILHVQFFLQYVKLCQIMDQIIFENYSIHAKSRKPNHLAFTKCDSTLTEWLKNCPRELSWDPARYNFWPAYLHCVYQTASCLLYRAYLPSAKSRSRNAPQWSPAFQSAQMITSVVEELTAHDELQYTPPFMIYTLLSALMIQVYQLRKTEPISTSALEEQVATCMDALEQVSKTWLIATMVHELFEIILSWCEIEGPDRAYSTHLSSSHETPTASIVLSDLGVQTPAESALLNSTSKVLQDRTRPLTPGLKDYMDAAVQFIRSHTAEPPISANIPHFGRDKQQPQRNPQKKGLQFLPEDGDLEWDDDDPPRTPASTGLNPAMWSEFFGVG